MRHIRPSQGATPPSRSWAEYVTAVRTGLGISKTELARRLNVARWTIHRWETGTYKPGDIDIVEQFAHVTGVPLDEAIAAAGFRPGAQAPREPTLDIDPVERQILQAPVDDRTKQRMLEYNRRLQEEDRRRRAEMIRMLLDQEQEAS